MTPEEKTRYSIVHALMEMARAFPNVPVTDDTFALYAERLAEFDPRVVKAAILHRIDRHKFNSFPTIGEIRETIFDLVPPDLYPTPDEAWGLVRAKTHRDYHGDELMERALDDIGGRFILDGDVYAMGKSRERFLHRYQELLDEARRDYAIAPDVRQLIDGIETPFLTGAADAKQIEGSR